MRELTIGLAIALLLANSGEASANWRDDNPNQPNGYAASMYRYHHGTPDDDGPHDGYRASSIRSRNGLDRFAPPSDDGGDGGGRWGSGGGGFGSGSGLGRHFRQGQAESEQFWQNRMQSQMPSQMQGRIPNQIGPAGDAQGFRKQYQQFQPTSQIIPMQQASMLTPQESSVRRLRIQQTMPMQYPTQSMSNREYPRQQFPPMYGYQAHPSNSLAGKPCTLGITPLNSPKYPPFAGNYPVPMSNNYHYAPNSTGYANAGALRSAVMQHPVGSLLRNSQGGFNQIYAPQQ